MLHFKALRLKTDVLMQCQCVPCMFGRVWLVSYADSFLEPQMRAGCQVWTKSGPTTLGEELNKRCCPFPDTLYTPRERSDLHEKMQKLE